MKVMAVSAKEPPLPLIDSGIAVSNTGISLLLPCVKQCLNWRDVALSPITISCISITDCGSPSGFNFFLFFRFLFSALTLLDFPAACFKNELANPLSMRQLQIPPVQEAVPGDLEEEPSGGHMPKSADLKLTPSGDPIANAAVAWKAASSDGTPV
ncbi:hypothetical protein [Salmonella enterica]|uniref:Uncharacterized protein n=1 Tax=Salmonella enterica I TaxID=59201 RepID=A0A8F6T1Y7_SALET|nr:hypothetical protein [Salmonella enterica]QXR78134.1 hypothetical protein DAX88_003840 [Salmonella enterica subsp. enterica]